MARDGDVPTIFNPKRVRAPSVIITSEEVVESERNCVDGDRERPNGPPTPLSPRVPLTPQASVCSAPPLTTQPSLQQAYSESATSSQDEERQLRDKKCPRSCCSKFAKKIYYGICVMLTLTTSWVTTTHCIKHLYLEEYPYSGYFSTYTTEAATIVLHNNSTDKLHNNLYKAPFFTAWFCTNWLIFFYPLYIIVMLIHNKCKSANDVVFDAFSDFKEKGFTFARFISRCGLFCLLWVVTIYMYTYSLKILLSTDVVALFATNVSCIYLLSWVILHEQFVGVRIVAAILCDTGIALLAYMDGITGSSTLGGVVLAACAAAGFAIFKVLFRKVMGEVNNGQRALFFSILGIVNASLLWPVCLALYLTGTETLPSHRMPWIYLLVASFALLVFHLVFQFGNIITYNIFVSLALITAVPVSAALDVVLYGVEFEGMKLAGIVLIVVGFFLVMLPDNWPDYIMRLLRWSRRRQRGGGGSSRGRDATDYRTGYIRSHLRSPSGRVR
ncbi:putative thiamine transporter SLC35F3 [Bombyx mandarina]|uniref:Thiamine transporter SLC35F3 n=2 Tax=Bombyx TaxID=7090 RepID=A0A8R2DK55_BOMMO|nr:putative thiamine transporter SLC35F3 [Bombyx mori]XP_028043642.1 putative thiamine transporter SLC35F3 [Bombyx mandarina]